MNALALPGISFHTIRNLVVVVVVVVVVEGPSDSNFRKHAKNV